MPGPTLPAVLFRCQASPSVGMGHLVRCCELARSLRERGRDSILIGPDKALLGNTDRTLFRAIYPVAKRDDWVTDVGRVLSIAARHEASCAVMDDYRIEPEYGAALRAGGIRFLQQFDASKPRLYHADILVNAGPYEEPEHYTDYLAHSSTRLLLGPKYAVLRPDFRRIVPRPTAPEVGRIFVCFGGGDDQGAILLTVAALRPLMRAGMQIDVVSGKGNSHKDAIRAELAPLRDAGINFHVDAQKVADLMRNADMAVIAGGTMSYETAICGTPSILIAIAGNQIRSCQGWQERAGAAFLGPIGTVTKDQIGHAAARLLGNATLRGAIASAGRSLVDGQGIMRITDAIIELEKE